MDSKNFTNNKYSIDNRIIPLFNVPITMKNIFEVKTNKYIDLNKQTEAKGAILRTANNNKEICNLYSKALDKYNSNISVGALAQAGGRKLEESNLEVLNKINLIGEIKEESNNINSIYNNYLNLIDRYLPYFVYYNSFFKLGLFLPRQLFKPQFYTYKYKGNYFPMNLLPESNLRQLIKKFRRGIKTLSKTPFIRKTALKKIIKGNLALIYLSSAMKTATAQKKINRINLIEKYFKLSTNVKINNTSKVSVKKSRKGLMIDNNILPIKPLSIKLKKEIIKNQPFSLEVSSLIENTNKKVIFIWQDKEVKNLLNNIIKKGDSLINELNSLILEKQNMINNNKVNNLFSLEISNNTENHMNDIKLSNNQNNITSPQAPQAPQVSGNVVNDLNNSIYQQNPIKLNYYLNNNPAVISSSVLLNSEEKSEENNTPIINQYLKSMSVYNMKKKGILIHYNNLLSINFVKGSLGYVNKLIFKIQKLLESSFKSMYCLISKPLFIITPDKITIRLFYFLFVPNFLKYKKLIAITKRREEKGFKGRINRNRIKQTKKQFNKFRKLKKDVRIKLRNLSNVALTNVFSNKFKILSLILSKLFKKPVELDLTRLHYAYNDSTILVNLLGIMINKIKLRIIIRRLFEKAVIKNLNKLPIQRSSAAAKLVNTDALSSGQQNNLNWKDSVNIPAFLSGIKIKVGGRLLTQSVVPRQTVKITQRGATQRGKINFLDIARYTRKNKRGAFSITIKSGQNLF